MASLETFSDLCGVNGDPEMVARGAMSDLNGNLVDCPNFSQLNLPNNNIHKELNEESMKNENVSDVNYELSVPSTSSVNKDDGTPMQHQMNLLMDGKLNNFAMVDLPSYSDVVANNAIKSNVPLENFKQNLDSATIPPNSSVTREIREQQFLSNASPNQLAVTSSTSQIVNAPLGSSQNPIRIIQQGNQFLSLQNLTPEQLAQVVQVVQQQQQQQQRNGGQANSTVQAQNKVVYKIVYPNSNQNNESIVKTSNYSKAITAAKRTDSLSSSSSVNNKFLLAGGSSQFQTKKKIAAIEASDVLTKLDKEQKKKHRPRTRSGRVSKPPQYMVKDYKHIHPVDYDEDYDDSDGGYSDFKISSGDEEEERGRKKTFYKDDNLSLNSISRSKRFKCSYCEKSYIGEGGLRRHCRLNPGHGKMDDDGMGELGGDSYYSSDSFQSGSLVNNTTNDETHVGSSFSSSFENKHQKDPNQQDEHVTLSLEVDTNTGESKHRIDDLYPDGTPRKGRRGRPSTSNNGSGSGSLLCNSGFNNSVERRRSRLLDFAKLCTDEDILDLFIQRCSSTVSLWKILMGKTAKLYDSSIDSLISEVSNLNEQVSTYLNDKLVPFVDEEDDEEEEEGGTGGGDDDDDRECGRAVLNNNSGTKNVFEMVDEKMAACLNIPIGKYIVKIDEFFEGSVHAEETTIYEQHQKHSVDSVDKFEGQKLLGDSMMNKHPGSSRGSNYSREISRRLGTSDIPIVLPPRKRLKLTEINQDITDEHFKLSRKYVRFDNENDDNVNTTTTTNNNNNDDDNGNDNNEGDVGNDDDDEDKNTGGVTSSLSSPPDNDDVIDDDNDVNHGAGGDDDDGGNKNVIKDKEMKNIQYDDITNDGTEFTDNNQGNFQFQEKKYFDIVPVQHKNSDNINNKNDINYINNNDNDSGDNMKIKDEIDKNLREELNPDKDGTSTSYRAVKPTTLESTSSSTTSSSSTSSSLTTSSSTSSSFPTTIFGRNATNDIANTKSNFKADTPNVLPEVDTSNSNISAYPGQNNVALVENSSTTTTTASSSTSSGGSSSSNNAAALISSLAGVINSTNENLGDNKIVNSLLQRLNQHQQQQHQQHLGVLQKQLQSRQQFTSSGVVGEYLPNALLQALSNSNTTVQLVGDSSSGSQQLINVSPFVNVVNIQDQLQLQQQIQQQQQHLQQQKQLEQQLLLQQQQQQQQKQLEQQLLLQQQQQQLQQQKQIQQQLLQQQQSQLLQQSKIMQQQQQPQQVCVTCYPLQEYIHLQENAQYAQTDDGLIVVRNPDGSYQIYGTITRNITIDMLEGLFNNNNNDNNINNNNDLSNNTNTNSLVNNNNM